MNGSTTTIPDVVRLGTVPTDQLSGATTALDFAKSIVVASQQQYEMATEELRSIKTRRDRLEAERVKLKAPILEAGRNIDALFNGSIKLFDEAERAIKRTMLTYQEIEQKKADEERRRHEEEVRKAQAEAERKAREAREKAEAEVRRQREIAAKAAAEAEEKARLAREATDKETKARLERERKAAEEEERKARSSAERAEQNGEVKAQAALQKGAEAAAVEAPVSNAPVAAGVASRSTWKAKVVNFAQLVKAVADEKTPIDVLVADEKVLNKMANALKGNLSKVCPGVSAVEERGLAVRK